MYVLLLSDIVHKCNRAGMEVSKKGGLWKLSAPRTEPVT
jgi:hypothetical protein